MEKTHHPIFGPYPTHYQTGGAGVWDWNSPHFSLFLARAAADPRIVNKKYIFHETNEFMTLYDGYPKARVHLLVVPKTDMSSVLKIPNNEFFVKLERYTEFIVFALTRIEHAKIGKDRIFSPSVKDKNGGEKNIRAVTLTFRHGVHAEPSLKQLHVHILSNDLDSVCLKNKKHWFSFQKPFLVSLPEVKKHLFPSPSYVMDHSSLKTYLVDCVEKSKAHQSGSIGYACGRKNCGVVSKTIPAMKVHIQLCDQMGREMEDTWRVSDDVEHFSLLGKDEVGKSSADKDDNLRKSIDKVESSSPETKRRKLSGVGGQEGS